MSDVNSDFSKILTSPLEVFRKDGSSESLLIDPTLSGLTDIDGVPIALLEAPGGGNFSLVRFDFDPPEFCSLNTMDGVRLSKDEFVCLVKATRAAS